MYYADRNAKNEDGSSVVQTLIQKAIAAETLHKTVMFKHDDVKTKIVLNILPIYENIPVTELLNYSDFIIIHDLVCLDYIRDDIVKQYKYVPSATKYNELKTVQFKFNLQKKHITLVVDPNVEHKGKTDITWKIVRDYGKKTMLTLQTKIAIY